MDVFNVIINDPLCGGLVRTTIFLSVGFCLVEGFLSLFKVNSPRIHQFCWLAVLLLGWVWVRPTLDFSSANHFAVSSVSFSETATASDVASSHSVYYRQITLIVLFVWTVGICAVLLRALRKYRQLCRHLSETVEPTAPWKEQWEKVAKYENLDQPVPMRISTQIGPALIRKYGGYEIVVPMELWKTLEPRERLCLLRIQLSHLRSRDIWKFFLVRVLVLPHWFNPLSWIALRRFDRSVDFASDEKVYQETSESPTRLRDTLLRVQEYTDHLAGRYTKEQQFALGRDFEKESKSLAERIQRLESLQQAVVFADSLLKKTGVVGLLTMMFLALIVQIESNETDAENGSAFAHRSRTTHSHDSRPSERSPNPRIAANADTNLFDLATEFTVEETSHKSEPLTEKAVAVNETTPQILAEFNLNELEFPVENALSQSDSQSVAASVFEPTPATEAVHTFVEFAPTDIAKPLPEIAPPSPIAANGNAQASANVGVFPDSSLAQHIPYGTVSRPGYNPSVPTAPGAPYPPFQPEEGTIEQVRGNIAIHSDPNAMNSVFTQPIHSTETPDSSIPSGSTLAESLENAAAKTAFDPVDDSSDSPYQSEEPFAKRFPNARTPFASQLIKPDFRPLVILDDQGNEVKNPAITLLHEKFRSFLQEGDVVGTMDMIRAVPDRRTRFTLLIEFCDQLAYQVKNAYSEREINEEELFQKVDQIGDVLGTASQTAKELRPDSVRDDAYAALAERNAHYVGDFSTAKETLLKVKSPLLRSNKLMELAELQKINDTPLNANETLRLSRESLKAAIKKGEIQQTDSLIKSETSISTSENTPLIR